MTFFLLFANTEHVSDKLVLFFSKNGVFYQGKLLFFGFYEWVHFPSLPLSVTAGVEEAQELEVAVDRSLCHRIQYGPVARWRLIPSHQQGIYDALQKIGYSPDRIRFRKTYGLEWAGSLSLKLIFLGMLVLLVLAGITCLVFRSKIFDPKQGVVTPEKSKPVFLGKDLNVHNQCYMQVLQDVLKEPIQYEFVSVSGDRIECRGLVAQGQETRLVASLKKTGYCHAIQLDAQVSGNRGCFLGIQYALSEVVPVTHRVQRVSWHLFLERLKSNTHWKVVTESDMSKDMWIDFPSDYLPEGLALLQALLPSLEESLAQIVIMGTPEGVRVNLAFDT